MRLAIRRKRRRLALIADDVFQAVGVDRAELLVKRLLNLIEYPPRDYESIVVVLVGSSVGLTRRRIGRHDGVSIEALWNLPRSGFEALYEQLPGAKPPLEDAWVWTGDNPRMLSVLYASGWRVESVVADIARRKELRGLLRRLSPLQLKVLGLAVDNPDVIDKAMLEAKTLEEKREIEELLETLVERNLVMELWGRDEGWLDQPPPERDAELGIGRYVAWQTPLHREAVRRALKGLA